MSMLRLVGLALAGVFVCAALSGSSAAKGTDSWQINSSFERAQGFGTQNFSRKKRYRRRDWGRGFLLFENPRWHNYRKHNSQRRKKQRFYGVDPEADVARVQGKPRSPDAGFETYQPEKRVVLSDPKLQAPKPAQVLASTILHELRSESSVRVTPKQRDAIVTFYRLNNFAPLWATSEGLNERARRLTGLFSRAEEEGLNPGDYLPPTLTSFGDTGSSAKGNVTALARLDISLTAMALRYAEHVHSGRIIPKKLSGYYDVDPPALALGKALYELSYRSLPDEYLRSLAPLHPAYAAMKRALAELRSKESGEQAKPIPAGKRVKAGERDARVVMVRERMVQLRFLSEDNAVAWMLGHPGDDPDIEAFEHTLDKELSKALKKFQEARDIKQTGFLDKATVEALNGSSEIDYAEKLIFNMERLRWLPRELGDRHVFVNQASFELRVVDRGSISWQTKVIVGKPETQTFVFSDQMETVVINPYWGVPQSIIRYEMMPYLAKDRRYLDRQGFEVLNAKGRRVSSRSVNWWAYGSKIPFSVRQPPGDDNALGRIKFLFPNRHDIYMHDTPTKKLFAEEVRAFSHGCIRVENPRDFAQHVLRWDRKRIDDMIATGENRNVKLDRHIPVHLTYFTAWPDSSSTMAYHADIYERDARLKKAFDTITIAASQ